MKNCSRLKTNSCASKNNPQPFSSFCKQSKEKDQLSYQCKSCIRSDRYSNPRIKKSEKDYYSKNRISKLYKQKESRVNNIELFLKRESASRDKNRESRVASNYKYRKSNRGIVNSHTANYKAKRLRATPTWLTVNHKKEIRTFYNLAKELEWLSDGTLEVDHIIPLQGKNVSGLHVPWNLQIIPKSINSRKRNNLWI